MPEKKWEKRASGSKGSMPKREREERIVRERKPTVQYAVAPHDGTKKPAVSDRNGASKIRPADKRGSGNKASYDDEDDDYEHETRKGQSTKKPWTQEEDDMVSR